MDYYHVFKPGLILGEKRLKGEYGRSLFAAGLSALTDPNQEYIREEVRKSHFPHKPSRLNSNFVFENLNDAITFRDAFRSGHCIYKVDFVNTPSVIHRVCYTAWTSDFPDHNLQANQFWATPANYATNSEVFAEEDIFVVQVLIDV